MNAPLQPCWFFPVSNQTLRNIASDNVTNLFLSFSSGEINAVNSESGDLLWKTDFGGKIISDILTDSKNIFLITVNNLDNTKNPNSNTDKSKIKNETKIRSLIKATGLTNWETKLPLSLELGNAYLLEYTEDIIVIGKQGTFVRINKKDGHIIWQANLNIDISTIPQIASDSIIFGTLDKQIISFPLSEKKETAKMKTSSTPIILTVSAVNQDIIWGDKKGFLNSVRSPSMLKKIFKNNWKFRNGGEISQIAETKEGLLITSFDNFVYLISKAGGELIWKRRFAGRIAFKPLIYGDFAVISVIGDSAAFIIEVSTGKIINRISIESSDFFTGSALISTNAIVFPTSKGLLSFSQISQKGCMETKLN